MNKRLRGWSALVLSLVLAVASPHLGCDGGGSTDEPDATGDDAADEPSDVDESDLPLDDGSELQDDHGTPEVCIPNPPPEAFRAAGPNLEGATVSPGGRALLPAGASLDVAGFPADVALHPGGRYALVTSTSADDRRLVVIDLEAGAVVQDLDRGEASFGLALSASGDRVYASGGAHGRVDVYEMSADDGALSPAGSIDVDGYPSGLALAPDGATLWVGLLSRPFVAEVDTASSTVTRELDVTDPVWDVLLLPSRSELVVSTLEGDEVRVIDTETGEVGASIPVGPAPAGMARSTDDDRVWVAVSGADRVVAIDPATRSVVAESPVAEDDLVDAAGAPLPNSNANSVALDATRGRIFVTRGADNAVTALDAETLSIAGSLPTAWYPTGVAVSADASTLVVIEGKGLGTGPSLGRSSKSAMAGSVTFVDLAGLDLSATSDAVVAQYYRPTGVFPFECEGFFPIPTRPDQVSPIEHVILIVKENKTFDCVFGDLTDIDVDADPELVRYGEEITPNQHALAREFAFTDNFYTEVEDSDMGHLLLTATHLTEYVERIWLEVERSDVFQGFQLADRATPEAGNFFTHLLDHDVDVRVYGEIVGMFARAEDGTQPFEFSDRHYPGGPVFNMGFTDESRARYFADRLAEGDLATFTFMLLPNDHTRGTEPGAPTPESMVADNDYAVGLVVEALSSSPYWESSAVFIVEDDPQGCTDHVDTHRSFLIVVSPWAHRRYVSHVNYSFVSVFATIERILGVPPLGRPDASASPTWDLFTGVPDVTPFEALERTVPDEVNAPDAPGAAASQAMDFTGPDRNPRLGVVLDAYRLWRMGRISREEAERRIDARLPPDRLDELEEEAYEESTAFEAAMRQYEAWSRDRGLPAPERPIPTTHPQRSRP